MTDPKSKKLATVKEVAAAYRVTPRTVQRWVASASLEVKRIGPRKGVRIVVDATSSAAQP